MKVTKLYLRCKLLVLTDYSDQNMCHIDKIYVVWSSKISLKSVKFTFQFSNYLVAPFLQSSFCRKPHWNWSVGSKDMSSWRMPKTIGNKRLFFWGGGLYLKISISNFLLILLDHITYQHSFATKYMFDT